MGLLDFLFGKKKSNDYEAILRRKKEVEQKRKAELAEARRRDEEKTKQYSKTPKPIKSVPKNIQKIIDEATLGVAIAVQNSNQFRDKEQECLINLFNLTQEKSSQLLHIPADKYNIVGTGFCLLLEYNQVRANEELSRAIADYAFFCISKAIEYNPTSKDLYLKRLSLVRYTHEFFFYTVANALNIPDSNPFDMDPMLGAPLIIRTNEYIYAMGKYDFEKIGNVALDGDLKEFHELCYGKFNFKTAKEGKVYIDKVNAYIANSISRY